VHKIKKEDMIEDVGISMPRIIVSLDNRKENYQSYIIEVEGKINNQPIAILIGFLSSHSYIDQNLVERINLKRCKQENSWLVQLATRTKRKIGELVIYFPLNMNGFDTKAYLKIIPLASYECLTGMDLLDKRHDLLDCYNKALTCIYEEGNSRTVQGIPRPIVVQKISALKKKRCFRKGCQIYASHV
jgi:hypothetical protein